MQFYEKNKKSLQRPIQGALVWAASGACLLAPYRTCTLRTALVWDAGACLLAPYSTCTLRTALVWDAGALLHIVHVH